VGDDRRDADLAGEVGAGLQIQDALGAVLRGHQAERRRALGEVPARRTAVAAPEGAGAYPRGRRLRDHAGRHLVGPQRRYPTAELTGRQTEGTHPLEDAVGALGAQGIDDTNLHGILHRRRTARRPARPENIPPPPAAARPGRPRKKGARWPCGRRGSRL